jgi:PAS domain S-box-containing protein
VKDIRRKTSESVDPGSERRQQLEVDFRALIENALDIVTLLDPDGTIRLQSPSVERHLGYKPEEMIGRNVFDFVHKDDRERVFAFFGTALQEALQDPGITRSTEFRATHRDGTTVFFESIGRLIADGPDKVTVLVNSRDITERKRVESQLRESEAKFRGIFEGSPDPKVIFNVPDGRILDMNNAFTHVYGYRPDEALGKTALQLGLWVNARDMERFVKDLSEHGEVITFETAFRAKDRRAIASAITAIRLQLGSLTCVHSVIRDITRQKNIEAELARARDAALEASRLKSAFLANTSHEIRTPLNVILGYSDLAAEHLGASGDHSQDAYFQGISRAGKRLLRTIDHVLDYSKIEAGALEIKPTPIRLAALLDALVSDLKVLAAAKGIEIVSQVGDAQAIVLFDEHCLVGALTNLIQNAIKFTAQGTITIRLSRDRSSNLELEISDTGIGIDKTYMAKLFQPFSQEETSYNRRFEGWGLGLALASKYLELNGASLSVSSKKDVGSTFTVHFASADEVRVPVASPVEEDQETKPAASAVPRRSRVLVVEDDADTQAFMQALLGKFYEVEVASSGEEMRVRLLEAGADVILMDLSLKGSEDGLALTRSLGKHAIWRKIPVIIITAYSSSEDRAKAAAAGCAAFVLKPIQRHRLLETIENVLANANGTNRGSAPGDRAA